MSAKDIAIIGMACRFPQADDVDAYWQNIRQARVCFSDIPKDRWDHELYYHPSSRETDKTYARKVGLLGDVYQFAAMHYNMPPLRVKVTDPQHRILLDAMRNALVDAGYEERPFPRHTTGVFVGASVSEHKDIVSSRLRATQLMNGQFGRVPSALPQEVKDAVTEDVTPIRAFTMAGNLLNMMAATVAQTFDLGGPAFTIDAACASSLVAAYEAVQYLRGGQCDLALVGGVYLNLTPDNLVAFSRIGAISRADACRPFDAAADGFVLGEGVGAVVLKRLDDALRDGDRVYAVIRGAGINNDGRGEGPMTPRKEGQVAVLARAYEDAGLSPETVGFIEAHGTATGVGDPTEIAALKEYYADHARGPVSTVVSSVKANIGHTMSAAGVAGLIKAALVVHEAKLPPQAAYETPHPALELAEGGFRVVVREEPWVSSGPRRAAVSSFGFGGTNCHLVLEESPATASRAEARPQPVVLSAPTPELLRQHISALRQSLDHGLAAGASVADVALTTAARHREAARVGFVARDRAELLARLDEAERVVASGKGTKSLWYAPAPLEDAEREIAFLFPGQGAQAIGLCRALYDRFLRFRVRLDELADSLHGVLPRPLLSYLYPDGPFDPEVAARELTATEVCQPAMAALGLALADFIESLGVKPVAVAGHSLGEFVAAGAAGLLTPEAALRFVAERGAIMAGLELPDPGAMAAIAADRRAVDPLVAEVEGVVLANLNHPMQIVASGTTAGVTALIARLQAAGIQATRLPVSHAFHSPLMAGAREPLAALVAALDVREPRVPVVSCIEPGPYAVAEARRIFVKHATAPVSFVGGVEACAALGARVFVQVGAGSALLGMARGTLTARGQRPAALVSLAATDADDTSKLCEALVELAVIGVPLSLTPLCAGEGRLVWLPPIPLQTEDYRAVNREARPELKLALSASPSSPGAGAAPSDALVKLFQDQMEVLKAQTEIIRRQTETLTGRSIEAPAAVSAPVIVPAPAPVAVPVAPVAPSQVEDKLIDLIAAVSAFPRSGIDPDRRLIGDLGFDSLMVVELVGKATEAFPGLPTLPKSLFVNDPSVRALVRHIEEALAHKRAPAAPRTESAVGRYVPVWEPRRAPALPALAEPPFAGPVAILGGGPARDALARRLTALGRKVAESNGVPEAKTIIDLRPLDGDVGPRDEVQAALAVIQGARVFTTYVAAHRPGSALAGLAKALKRERPEAKIKAITVDGGDPVEPIVAELTTTDATVEVSYAGGVRQVVVLAPAPPVAGAFRDGVVAVVSGGARGLGLKIAVELARRHRARVALLGRAGGDAAVAAVRAAGGEAVFCRCDVTDPAEVAAAVTEARKRLGPIEVVVHAAGVLADAPAAKKDLGDAARVVDTKAGGAQALVDATAGDPLRCFLALTSWAGRFGNAAQTDYAAANHWVAARAARWGEGRGARFVALDLPPWEGTAMVGSIPEPVKAAMREAGVTFLDDATGLALVCAELGGEGPSGEVLLGRDVPAAERADEAVLRLSVSALPLLDDHRVNGHPVLPLVAAANLALEAAQRVLGAPARLTRLEVGGGVVADGDTTVWVRAEQGSGPVSVEIHAQPAGGKRSLAYRAEAERAAGALPALAAPAAGERPSLSVEQFYREHTFHGPRLQGIVTVDAVSDTHIEGTVRASAGRDPVDTVLFDSCLQLAAFWAIAKHGRAGLPLGLDELRLLGPIAPESRVKCLLLLERAEGDLFAGNIDLRDEAGNLVAQLRGVRGELASVAARPGANGNGRANDPAVDPAYYQIDQFPEVKALRQRLDLAQAMGIVNPYFNLHERVTNDTSVIDGRELINFSSYNYLGFSGDDEVNRAVAAAAERYGTSVSASRVASGEKPLHRELEGAIARFLGCEDSIVMVGGHATNVGVIGHLFGAGDLIVHDSLAHDSILGGALLSGAKRRPFPHNDWEALDRLLGEIRHQYKKVLIAVEGTYSMDGDVPRLDKLIEVKKRHKGLLLVDEAHSFGVLGSTGRGIGEHFDVDRRDVELWMGTLSKTLASCGGYIAGSKALVEYLKYTCGAFVYSVGISPPNAASALTALAKLEAHPEIVRTLQQRARFFLELCRERGINTGMSEGTAVVPCIVGNSWDCLQLAQALNRRGINVQPILYPAVEEQLARLRFFITSRHSEAQLRYCADTLAEELVKLNPAYLKRPPGAEATGSA